MRFPSVNGFLLFLSLPIRIANAELYEYKLLASAHIAAQLEELPRNYPELATLTTAQEAFNLPYAGSEKDCTFHPQTGCPNFILTIQDSILHPPESYSSQILPEVFLSGALHGNERVGPTAVLETAKLLLEAAQCESLPKFTRPANLDTEEGADWLLQAQLGEACRNALKDDGITDDQRKWLARLVSTRRIVVVPMTNALGYDRNERTEGSIDPNRDFPYDVTDVKLCMQTIAGRTVNELFQRHMFQMSLTYHGGTEVVAYEWGAFPYLPTNHSPDDNAQAEIASAYSRFAGKFGGTKQYPTGTMNDLVYAVHGGMEDWAYAGSWDINYMRQCEPTTYGGYDKANTVYNESTLRAFNMLIETSDRKIPHTHLGTNQGLLEDETYENNGHVARNIRLALTAIELVQPYVSIRGVNTVPLANDVVPLTHEDRRGCMDSKAMSIPPGQKSTTIAWSVGGGFTVDFTNIMYAKWDDVPDAIDCFHQPLESELGQAFRTTVAVNGPTRWKEGWRDGNSDDPPGWDPQGQPMYFSTIDLSVFKPGDKIAVFATARLDQGWTQRPDGTKPNNVPPMSHVVNARTNPAWYHESAGKIIQGRQDWYSIPLTLVIGENGEDSPPAIDLSNRFIPILDDLTHQLIKQEKNLRGGNEDINNGDDDADSLIQNTDAKDESATGQDNNSSSQQDANVLPSPNILLFVVLSLVSSFVLYKFGRWMRTRRSGMEKVNILDDEVFHYGFDPDEDIQLRELS